MTHLIVVSKKRKLLSFAICMMLVSISLLVGITIHIPTAKADFEDHTVGNLDILALTDFGRVFLPISWGVYQSTNDPSFGSGFIGLVIDHDNYTHTPGSINIADSFSTHPYFVQDDFSTVIGGSITLVVDDGTTQKSFASFMNTGSGTGDPNDILINQTCWAVLNKDWAIIQWNVKNIKSPAVDITGLCIGLELPLSQVGALNGLGGDSGDDIDGFDGTDDIYWAQDDNGAGTCIGLGSAFVSDPITHYYSKDYHPATYDDYKVYWQNDTWLYDRIHAPNSVEGNTNAGNRTSMVGWNGITIPGGTSRTFTLVIAANDTFNNMVTAVNDAQEYYDKVITTFHLTEFSDSESASTHIEVYNDGNAPTDLAGDGYFISTDGGLTALSGSWSPTQIQTYEYSVLTVTGGTVDHEGGTIGLYQDLGGGNIVLIDGPFSYGQDGIIPDPAIDESVARRFDETKAMYSNEWLRNASSGPTWGGQNNVGTIDTMPPLVLNRVMFNPLDPVEGYVELMNIIIGNLDISGYSIVCENGFKVPQGTTLNSTNRFYVLTYSDFPTFFTNMDAAGDNVYLYDNNGNLLDMVGWSFGHTPGYYMSRDPDGNVTSPTAYQGYDDTTSLAAGWVFDQLPTLMITEFYADPTSTDVELYNPRGGDKVLDARWNIQTSTGGPISPTWTAGTIPADGGYDDCTSSGPAGAEGDTISLYFNPGSGDILIDEVSYGTYGVAPDPLLGESTARYWNSTSYQYHDEWNRDISDTFGSQNDVPGLNLSSYLILNEVVFNPMVNPDGKYVVLTNRDPHLIWDVLNYTLVSDGIYQIPFSMGLGYGNRLIIRYGDDSPTSDSFFTTMNAGGDNVYLYDPDGRLVDMVGWNTAHTQGMSVRRVPSGNGTNDGYDDISSVAAGWVFNSPLEVLMTEISDSGSATMQIELYNPWYPLIDFSGSFTFESDSGPITPNWIDSTADIGEYALLQVSAGTLSPEGDTISCYQSGVLVESISYGIKGIVPDPLNNESVQRYWDGSRYTDVWERNWTSGPNFGAQNDVPPANFSTPLVLNEVLFYPSSPSDAFVEVHYIGAVSMNISGYKIICDTEYIIPEGTFINFDRSFYYLFQSIAPVFFSEMNSAGDNVYLYDQNGSLLDMVGWSSQHSIGGTIGRVPNGNGTNDGYDDVSSVAAGWRFDLTPTVSLIKVTTEDRRPGIKYGHFGGYITFNLTIYNFQEINDTINILYSSQEGWPVEIWDKNMTALITNITIVSRGKGYIIINVTLPDSIPFAVMDNITIEIRSSNSPIIGHSIILNPRIYPFLNLTKSVIPNEIYLNGSGHDEKTTLILNMTAMGALVAVRKFVDCVFCIDSSGSMDWNDHTDLRIIESQNFVAKNFEMPDRAAIVDFDENAWLIPDGWPTGDHLSSDYATIIDNFNYIDSFGGTFLSAGLNLSNEELRFHGMPNDHTGVIIVITDAEDLSPGDIYECYNEANIAANRSVIIFTIGLTIDTPQEQQLLEDIANITGGMYFEAPNPGFFSAIYENISSYLADIAVWDQDPFDPIPMVRDVLPSYIDYIPGSFSIPPSNIYSGPGGETIIEWNVNSIKLGETWTVTFDIKSNQPGMMETNVYNLSRAEYYTWANTTETVFFPHSRVNVIPPEPYPPKLYIDILPNKNDIFLYWDEPLTPGTDHYLIYRSPTPTGFDFSSPWKDTSSDVDPGDPGPSPPPVKNRLSWNDTGAADPSQEQWYYCIRSVSGPGEMSRTSRTVGKWTKIFPGGNGTFSLPLEPLEVRDTEFYCQDMNARFIKWMDPVMHTWIQHDKGEIGDNTVVEVGKGYEIDFISQTKYTFLGMPGAMIRYNLRQFAGFDYSTEAYSLNATVNPNTDDVSLNWTRPAGMDGNDRYHVYRSTTRDGFDGSEGVNYTFMISINYGTETWTDIGAALPGTQYYYMIIPFNETDTEGSSTYSIGVWTASYKGEYDTMGIPLILDSNKTTDWYCDNIVFELNNTVGINFFIILEQRWGWHLTRMPAGIYDPILIMTEGYQISTTGITRYSFVGH